MLSNLEQLIRHFSKEKGYEVGGESSKDLAGLVFDELKRNEQSQPQEVN